MGKPRSASDEHYLIDLCDRVLGRKAKRQHRFDFLRGDSNLATGRSLPLPVDAFYEDLDLVVEIMERQHDEPVPFFDRRPTLSGISRGEQRRRYDQRRTEVLPANNIRLVILEIAAFQTTGRKKLLRIEGDLDVVRSKLQSILACL